MEATPTTRTTAGRETTAEGEESGPTTLRALTYNLYLGFPLDPLVGVTDPEEVPQVAGELYDSFLATDFPARAASIAASITDASPDLVGLQEVFDLELQPADGGTVTPRVDGAMDFLDELDGALGRLGAAYDAVAENVHFRLTAPARVDGDLVYLQGTNRNVVLAREGVRTRNTVTRRFSATLERSVGGVAVRLARGYEATDATVGGTTVRFANTHLESADAAVRAAQARELLADLRDAGPTVLVGDCNSPADGDDARTYELLTDQFADAWVEADPDGPGATCCQAADLANDESRLDRRIDLVLARGHRAVVSAERVGDEPTDRTASGLWPSDHAGVAATLEFDGSATDSGG